MASGNTGPRQPHCGRTSVRLWPARKPRHTPDCMWVSCSTSARASGFLHCSQMMSGKVFFIPPSSTRALSAARWLYMDLMSKAIPTDTFWRKRPLSQAITTSLKSSAESPRNRGWSRNSIIRIWHHPQPRRNLFRSRPLCAFEARRQCVTIGSRSFGVLQTVLDRIQARMAGRN